MIMMDENYVLDRIEAICQKKGYSHYRLSLRSGVSQSQISTMFTRRSTPNVFTLEKLCKGLDLTLAQFFADGKSANLTEEEEYLLSMWDMMTDLQKAMTMAYLQGLKDSKN